MYIRYIERRVIFFYTVLRLGKRKKNRINESAIVVFMKRISSDVKYIHFNGSKNNI